MLGGIDAIHHENFWKCENQTEVLDRIRSACEQSEYTLTKDLQSLGTSIGEYDSDPALQSVYFADAPKLSARIRQDFFFNAPNPLDALRANLDEFWGRGCTVARDELGHMLPAVVRRWIAGGSANPHIDACDIPALRHLQIQRRIGTNIYLAVPPDGCGGEIEFWGRIRTESEYNSYKREDYGLDRAVLGEPLAVLKPQSGDLLMFDASQVHAVAALTEPDRVSLACFVGYSSTDRPLMVFA